MMSGTAEYDLTLSGLSCASCVRRAEMALSAVPGVSSATVNLATANARVVAEPGLAEDLVAAANTAGYPAEVSQTRLDISDMSCASCVARVEKALAAVPGVISAEVNLATHSANVTHLGGANTAEAAAAASSKLGYPAKVVSADGPQTDDNRHEAEAATLARKTWIAAALTLPVFLLEMGGHLFPAWHHFIGRTIGHETSWIIQFALTTAVLAGPGRAFYTHGLRTLAQRAPDMNALVAVGTGAAYLFSLVALFLPGLLPEGTRAVYFEAAAVIVTLILVGRMLEARAKGRTGAAIRKLLALSPDTAEVWRDGAFREIPATDLQTGERVRIRPGARVPADGEVIDGFSYVDESMITGEPLAVQKSPGSPVTGGTVNGTGALEITTTTVGADSTLSRIVAMVQDAQSAKLPVQAMVDRVTAWFVPAVMTAAVLTVAVWLIFGGLSVLSLALVAGVSVLIIACPCAMGLATPTSIMVGTGRAAEMGVLFRKGDALQRLSEITTVAFDKTGTLTEGRPAVTDIAVAEGFAEEDVLALAAAAEARSEHPLARAIVAGAEKRHLALAEATGFRSTTGQGIEALVDGRTLRIGNASFAEPTPRLQAAADRFAKDGKTAVFVATDGTPAGVIAISDPIKAGSAETIAALHAAGLKVAMISGDAPATANAIGARLGIDTVIAGVLPDGKVAALKDLAQSGPLAFVGDGINDAPALAAADVGIAMGTGTDIAIESADVVLMSGRPEGVRNAVKISTATVRNIRQNLFWAFAYNTLLIPVAAGLLYIFGGPLLSPMLAAGAMALSSVFVVSNALRLRRVAPAGGTGTGGGDQKRSGSVTAATARESLA